jgi:DNA-binding HxlR family transcriptional regulator
LGRHGTASSLRRQVSANHRTLSTYLNTLSRDGLLLTEVSEPRTAMISKGHP